MNTFNYEHVFTTGNLSSFMKPLDSPWVALGPSLQILRGFIFAIVLWPFRSIFLHEKNGWFKLWLLFIGLSILATFGPAIGSIDGMIYTTIPISQQILFLPELITQSFLLSFFIFYWYLKPKKVYKIISITLVSLIILMSIAGYISLNN
ncbi:hypothetical protein [Algoriphagus sp.]|uniref:hypothetical protein n=1 Tax=Algoriphagus sp. TaxID=1872435 RepID=UPI0025CF21D8|nr:hypothetical protein [Algoriphagus sp.]